MDTDYLPPFSLRYELITILAIYAEEAGEMPVLSPRGVLAMLNDIGPETGDRWLPLIDATLDAMWQEGLVARIPAPSPYIAAGYCCRRFAEKAIRLGAPIILLPRKDGVARHRRARGRRVPLPTGDTHGEGS